MNRGKYSRLAQQAAEHYVLRQEPLPLPEQLGPDFAVQKACYITIYENPGRRFRAMYGSPLPISGALAEEIIRHATKAVGSGSFRTFRKADLRDLVYEVAILGPLERVGGPEHLDPAQFGLYIRSDKGKSSIVLPQRTGIDSPDEQLATGMRESGISLREEAPSLYRFSVNYHE